MTDELKFKHHFLQPSEQRALIGAIPSQRLDHSFDYGATDTGWLNEGVSQSLSSARRSKVNAAATKKDAYIPKSTSRGFMGDVASHKDQQCTWAKPRRRR